MTLATGSAISTELYTSTLMELELVIERGLETFLEVGKALAEIQDRRLYQATHDTFGSYCAERWGISRPRAYQLIGAAKVVSTVVDKGLPPPSSERVARELVPMLAEPEALTEAWRKAGPSPTAAEVRGIVGTIRPSVPFRRRPAAPARIMTNIADSLCNYTEALVELVPEAVADAEHRDSWIKALRLTRARVNKALRTLEGA